VKHTLQRTVQSLSIFALLASTSAYCASNFDPTINRLFMTSVAVNAESYQNVSATVNSYTLLAVDNGAPGTDTFDPTNNLLTMGSVVFQGTTYSNVRVLLNSYTLLAATLVTPGTPGTTTPTTPTPTPPTTTPTPPTTPATPASPSGTLTAANTCSLSNFQTDLMALINQARASNQTCGITSFPATAALAWNSKLFDASAAHSADMANNNYFSHTSLDGRTFDQRISAAGYGWSRLGENIAAGQSSAASVMAGWMASPGHCSNIMGANFTEVGVACVINNSSTYHTYWTMDLGKP
jgi:uncharacterized protein YkwD